MASLEIIMTKFRDRENEPDILKANWYIIAAPCIAAANAGKDVPELYRLATNNEPKERRLLIQRRLKEALLKTGVLYGFPRLLNALYPLFKTLDDDEIDNFSPRYAGDSTAPMQGLTRL
ncbi:hypothetical protein LTR10_017334 [Elasticomyces elasticus]|nr:hypothetical protein LTR10_017334 [Elasticomyces elasticus]